MAAATGNKTVKKKDDVIELENQFILRLPPDTASELNRAVKTGAPNLKDRLSIELKPDGRHGTVVFDGVQFSAKLFDLPCVIESHKTIDRKTFYKTADISQLLICKYGDDDSQESDEENLSPKRRQEREAKKYQWNHGVTPPLKNVRKRRFRKTLKKKYLEEAPDIEKEVKRLFRHDNEAINVRFEIVEDRDDRKSKMDATGDGDSKLEASVDIAEHDIFGEVVSSSEEDEAVGNINIMDSGDEDASNLSMAGRSQSAADFIVKMDDGSVSAVRQDDSDDGDVDLTNLPPPQSAAEIQARLAIIKDDLEEIRHRRRAQEREIANTENIALKTRFEGMLAAIIEEEAEKEREYQNLAVQLFGR